MSLCIRNGVTYKRHQRSLNPNISTWRPNPCFQGKDVCIHCGEGSDVNASEGSPEIEGILQSPNAVAGQGGLVLGLREDEASVRVPAAEVVEVSG